MSENQIISFLEFVNQDDEDKYNMLVESVAIIQQKENIIKEVREILNQDKASASFNTAERNVLEILDKENKYE